jgi:thiol-disulfide isomerase/thioredoxin
MYTHDDSRDINVKKHILCLKKKQHNYNKNNFKSEKSKSEKSHENQRMPIQRKKCNKKYKYSKKIHESPTLTQPEITNLTKKLTHKINKTVSQSTTVLDTIPEKSLTLKLFYADWCGHCSEFKPIWFKLKSKYPDIHFIEVDCTNNQPSYQWLTGYPTIAIFENNNFIQIYKNNRSYDALRNFINELN